MDIRVKLNENYISYRLDGSNIELRKYKDPSKAQVKNAIYIYETTVFRPHQVLYVGKSADTKVRNRSHSNKWWMNNIKQLYVFTSEDLHQQYRTDIEQFLIMDLITKYDLANKVTPREGNPVDPNTKQMMKQLLYIAGLDTDNVKLDIKEANGDIRRIESNVKENVIRNKPSIKSPGSTFKSKSMTQIYVDFVQEKQLKDPDWLGRVYEAEEKKCKGKTIKRRTVAKSLEDLFPGGRIFSNREIENTGWYLMTNLSKESIKIKMAWMKTIV